MLEKTPLDRVLFLDIETVPQTYQFPDLEETTRKLFEAKTRFMQNDEKSFEELIKALKELTAAQAPAASAPGLLEKAGNFISDPLGFKKDREDKANAKKPAAPSAKMPTQMDVRIMNVDDLATRIASKMPSDRRLKTNIKEIGKSKLGIKLYEFNYKHNLSKRYVGCMAQDLIGTEFEKALIIDTSGYYIVDYSYLDVECTEI